MVESSNGCAHRFLGREHLRAPDSCQSTVKSVLSVYQVRSVVVAQICLAERQLDKWPKKNIKSAIGLVLVVWGLFSSSLDYFFSRPGRT